MPRRFFPGAPGLTLLALVACVEGGEVITASPEASAAAFVSQRRADTTDERGPYRVHVLQLSGMTVSGARLVFRVEREGEAKWEGRRELQPAAPGRWSAEIPGQPHGSTVRYHFELDLGPGTVRHPAHPAASYRFQVTPLVPGPMRWSGGAGVRRLSLDLKAAAPPSGALVVHRLPRSPEEPEAIRVPLQPTQRLEAGRYRVEAALPRLEPGQIADFHFDLVLPDGKTMVLHPAGAPEQSFSIKHPLLPVQPLPVRRAMVLALGIAGDRRWVGFRGAGVVSWEAEKERALGIAEGLPSGVVRFVEADPAAERVWVGTDGGLAEVPFGSGVVRRIRIPGARKHAPVGPGAVSTLDGTLLFQVHGEPSLEGDAAAARFFELSNKRLSRWRPQAGPPFVGWTAGGFDPVAGCWLLGGLVAGTEMRLAPAVIRRCGDSIEGAALQHPSGAERDVPVRVVALAADPSSGGLAAAVELRRGTRETRWGVFGVDLENGALSPLAAELTSQPTEVTALAADWRRSRLLVGTFGAGLWAIRDSEAGSLDLPAQPGEVTGITRLTFDPEGGTLLLGTSTGAYRWTVDLGPVLPWRGEGPAALPGDAQPMDVEPGTGRVLLSSRQDGLAEVTRSAGEWVPDPRLGAALGPRDGLFGDAAYTADGGLVAVLHNQGLLRVGPERPGTDARQWEVLGVDDGLHSRLPLRVLAHSSGRVWLSFTPLPTSPGAPIQIFKGSRVFATLDLASTQVASIGRWIEDRKRKSVLAATRAGVVELTPDGGVTKLSRGTATSLAHDPASGALGVVGSSILRWDGQRFQPVLFAVEHPRAAAGRFVPGSPIDLAIDGQGRWHLLYPGGLIAVLDPEGRFLGILDGEDGIPLTARRLLSHPATGEVFVGSAGEGVVFTPPPAAPGPDPGWPR